MGRAVPKLFREPLRSANAGETLRECIRASVSAICDRVAGTSIVFDSSYSDGTVREAWDLGIERTEPWLAILRRLSPLELVGRADCEKSESSNAGMLTK